MRFTIIGAGAMGCLIGGRLQWAGHDVSYIARGAQLAALQTNGLTLETTGDRWNAPVTATDEPHTLGTADAVLLTTKSYQLPDVAAMVGPLLGNDTIIVPITNGMPWWYFFKHGGEFDNRRLQSLDPDGALKKLLPIERIVGGVNYLAGTMVAPGHVHYVKELERRLVAGELDGSMSPRLEKLCSAFDDAGFAAKRSDAIRQVIWHKLWGNIAFNPVSALTSGTQDQLAGGYRDIDGNTDIDLMSAIMNEARFIADKLGIEMNQTTASRIMAAAKMKGHKTSMCIDIESGKKTEIEAIVGVVREIANWLEVPTPHLNCIYTLVRMKEQFACQQALATNNVRTG